MHGPVEDKTGWLYARNNCWSATVNRLERSPFMSSPESKLSRAYAPSNSTTGCSLLNVRHAQARSQRLLYLETPALVTLSQDLELLARGAIDCYQQDGA